MRQVRALAVGVVASMAGLALPALEAPAAASVPTVSVTSDSADINMFEFVNPNTSAPVGTVTQDTGDSNFFSFAHHLGGSGSTVSGPSGTSTAFVRQASTITTSAQPPFPVLPVGDIALDGLATSAATVTNDTSTGVPVTFSEGTFSASISLDQDTPVFFSGFLQTIEQDLDGECSYAYVDISGGAFTRHYEADSPAGCRLAGATRQKGWAESATMTAGTDYEVNVDYYSELDDTPNEAHSMTASANASFNLAFMPPSAAFTTKLSGSKATFNAGGSSAGAAARPLASYRWTFGDGKKATTTTPTVTHGYPTSPTTAPTYKVVLQVVDNGGAISAPVSHLVHGTATTLAISKTATKLKATGKVTPRRGGHHVVVTLARKSSGSFHVLATHKPTLTSTSTYATSFARPHPGTCRLVTRYPGDATHLASMRTRVFAC
jgi:hypothetical protein